MTKPYSELKSSNIEWVYGIPYDWEVKPLFSVAEHSNESNIGMIEDNLLSLSYGRIVKKNINTLEGLLPASFETYQVVNPDYIVFRLTDLQNDKRSLRSAIVKERGIITSAYVAVKPLKVNPNFFHYLMRSYDETKVFYNLGSGMRQSLKYSELKRLPIVIPPPETQQAIVKHLDTATNRVNSLIHEKQNFINLLKEKRHALISHVVTKGLDPNVEMKDSGVEWIGEIPKHWNLVKLKNLTTSGFKNGVFKKSDDFGFGTKLINVSDIFTPDFYIDSKSLERVNVTDSEKQKYSVYYGDIFFVRSSLKLQGIGHACCYKGNGEDVVFECHIVKSTPDPEKVVHDYLIHALHSSQLRHHLVVESTTTTMTTIGQTGISKALIPLPPVDEQKKIASSLLRQLERIEKITTETYRSIELLKERRTALISAAVTGKIDLREKEKELA